MELDKLKDLKDVGGVKELWRGKLEPEVKDVWEKAREGLENGKDEKIDAL